LTDPKGTDIYLKTGNNTGNPINNAVHQAVCVDLWDPTGCNKTGIACWSFGWDSSFRWWWFKGTWLRWKNWTSAGYLMEGVIYREEEDVGTVTASKKTTVQEDISWLRYMSGRRQGMTDVYSVLRHNCRRYSQWEFRDAPAGVP
jgi:hypothetical protein